MTKNILAVVGGLALVALLGANAVATFGAGEQSPSGTGGALRVADLPINRSFHQLLPSGNSTMQFPMDGGIIITEIGVTEVAGGTVTIDLNNIAVAKIQLPANVNGTATSSSNPKATQYQIYKYRFEPPLLVRPGSLLNLNCSRPVNLNGHLIYDTDL